MTMTKTTHIEQLLVLEAMILIIIPWSHHLTAQASLAKPNCLEKCGNISVPFPFGIGPHCFWYSRYEMQCEEKANNSARLTLKSIGIEVINISPVDRTLTFAYPINLTNPFCRGGKNNYSNNLYNVQIFTGVYFDMGSVKSIPFTLNWMVMETHDTNSSQMYLPYASSSNRVCRPPHSNGYITTYACECNSGYQGNPYIEDGCLAYFTECIKDDQLFDIVDHHVLSQGRREEVMAFANLARRCLCLNGKKRPPMKEVASKLESIRNLSQENSMDNENQGDRDRECLESEDTKHIEVPLMTSFRSEMTIDMVSSLEDSKPLIGESLI